jgi:flagellar export protein FliJ
MSNVVTKRAMRMARLFRISDAIAKASEGEMRDRQAALDSENERLQSVQNYRHEYSSQAVVREQKPLQMHELSQGREFAIWLMSVESNQLAAVERCGFIAEAARESAIQARRFAHGLELIAKKRQNAVTKYQNKQEQDQLDSIRPPKLSE